MNLSRDELIEAAWFKAAEGQGRGSLKFLLRRSQYPIYEAIWDCLEDSNPEHTSHVVNCARQFGKSFTEFVIATEVCLGKESMTTLFVAPYKDQALEILTGKTYFTIFETCPASLKPKLDGATVVFPNASRIRLGGTDNRNYEYLRGGAADLLILDEAGFMSNLDTGVLPALQPMLTTTRGKTIFSSTPPPNLDHHYVNLFRQHAENGYVSTFTIFDNTALTPEDLIIAYTTTGCTRNADGTWKLSTRFRREFMAEMVMEGTILIAKDWVDEFCHVPEENEYHQFHHRYVSMDPGVTDFNATLFGYYDHINRHLHISRELTHSGQTLDTDLLASDITRITSELWPGIKPYRYIADNNNLHLIQDLKRLHDLPFVGTTKTTLETRKSSQDEGMVNKLNTWLREGRISVDPSCEMLLGCLKHGIWKEDRENVRSFSHSKKFGHYDHLAALIYMVRNVDVNTNPVPANYRFNPQSMFKPPETYASKPQNLRTLAGALVPRR
jgi:hypothetical protein